MKIAKKLGHLQVNACHALNRPLEGIRTLNTSASSFDGELRMSYATIGLLNTWANFQKAYFISCMLGAKSKSGIYISSSATGTITTPQEAIGKAILLSKPNCRPRTNGEWDSRDEPKWHDSSKFLSLSSVFSFTNLLNVQAAFSLGFTAHKNLVVFRNYYGHKNRVTREKAQAIAVNYLIPQNLHPTKILLSNPNTSPSTHLIEMWASELVQTAEFLCK